MKLILQAAGITTLLIVLFFLLIWGLINIIPSNAGPYIFGAMVIGGFTGIFFTIVYDTLEKKNREKGEVNDES